MLNKETTRYAQACPRDLFPSEKNDCVPRALSLAANRPYAEVHALCAQHGRKPGKGTTGATCRAAAEALGGVHVPLVYGYAGYAPPRRSPTLAHFIRCHPVGSFYVNKRGHGFAVIDGVVHDWNGTSGPLSRVTMAYKFTKEAA